MIPQAAPLAPDVEYYMDSALEHGELDAGSFLTIKLYAPRAEVMRIVDFEPSAEPPTFYRTRLRKNGMLVKLADDLIEALPDDKRAMIAHAGIRHLHHRVLDLAEVMAWWAIEDEIKGGCMKAWKRPVCRRDRKRIEDYVTTKRQDRKLHAPSWIRRYTKTCDSARDLRTVGTHALLRLSRAHHPMPPDGADLIADELAAAHEGYRRWNEDQMRRLRSTFVKSVTKNETHKHRQIIKRAASTAQAILGRQPVSDFANGRPVRLRGAAIDIEVQRAGSSATRGHSGIFVAAVDGPSGRKLADLCVYHEDTPALDQLTALHLAVAAGEEAEIVRTANIVHITDLGLKHPLLEGRAAHRAAAERRPRDDRREKNHAYWIETKPMWLESLGVFVLGRSWNPEALA